jgi:hypothetical protein
MSSGYETPSPLIQDNDKNKKQKRHSMETDRSGNSSSLPIQKKKLKPIEIIKTNVMQICTTDDINFNNITDINKNLTNVYHLLMDNLEQINNLDQINNGTIDFYETENLFMFNVVDLLPQDTFRYCLNAYKGITTINERQVSQMVDDITSYIETNYAGYLNDNGAWDDVDPAAAADDDSHSNPEEEQTLDKKRPLSRQLSRQESASKKVKIYSPEEQQQKLLKTLEQFIYNSYNPSDGVKNYKNLFMFMSMYLVADNSVCEVQNDICQLSLRYVITYIILCNYAGPTLVFMLDVKDICLSKWYNIKDRIKNILLDVLQSKTKEDEDFEKWLGYNLNELNLMLKSDSIEPYGGPEKINGVGGGKDYTTDKSRNITHQNDISKSSDQYSNAIIKMSGGSCQNITYFNPLLSVKCSYEWSHDFSSGRAQKYVMNDKSFYYNDGIFEIVKKGWKYLTDHPDNLLNASVSSSNKKRGFDDSFSVVDDGSNSVFSGTIATETVVDTEHFDKKLFRNLKNKTHKEENYLSTIIDTMLSDNDCGDVTQKFMYIPIVRFSIETDDVNLSKKFKNSINQYFDGQRMFTKLGDNEKKYHLYVTSDNTPKDKVVDSKLKNYLEDMGVDDLEIALGISRKSLYSLWEDHSVEMFNFNKGDTYYTEMKEIIKNINEKNKKIVSPARIIDPITPNTGAELVPPQVGVASVSSAPGQEASVLSASGETAVSSEETATASVAPLVAQGVASTPTVPPNYQQISVATLYGINKLLGLWINTEKIIEKFEMIPTNGPHIGIKFTSTTSFKFDWQVGDSTVNSVCNALISAKKFFDNYKGVKTDILNQLVTNETDTRNKRLFTIVNFIMTHPNFRFKRELDNFQNIDIFKQYFYTILSFLKSCGDEYQRLTCESINMQGVTAFLLTKDRILVAESIEKDTPTYSCLQSPTTNIYLDQADEFELFYNKYKEDIKPDTPTEPKKNEIGKKNTGIISNRRNLLEEDIQVDLPTVYNNLIKEIYIKLYGNPNLVPAQVPAQVAAQVAAQVPAQVPDKLAEKLADKLAVKPLTPEQVTNIPKLKKIVVALSYYMLDENYENIIECEVGKALSQTINPDLLKNISIKNTCITSDKLLEKISFMFDEPNIIDQFIKSYGIAVESFKQKLETYIKIIDVNKDLMDNLFPAPQAPIQLSTELTAAVSLLTISRPIKLSDNVVLMYRYYIAKLNEMPKTFSDNIKKILEDTIKQEETIRRSSRERQSVVPSTSDAVPELENELAHLQREMDKLDKKTQPSEQTSSVVGKIASATKKFFNSLKRDKAKIQIKMQSLMKKIEESEIKFAKSVKRITVETYRNTLKTLFPSQSSRTGGRKITRKLYKNKNKKKSKQRHYNYARKQSIKNKNKYIHKFIKTKKVKM